jgi:hypothetical protein
MHGGTDFLYDDTNVLYGDTNFFNGDTNFFNGNTNFLCGDRGVFDTAPTFFSTITARRTATFVSKRRRRRVYRPVIAAPLLQMASARLGCRSYMAHRNRT